MKVVIRRPVIWMIIKTGSRYHWRGRVGGDRRNGRRGGGRIIIRVFARAVIIDPMGFQIIIRGTGGRGDRCLRRGALRLDGRIVIT